MSEFLHCNKCYEQPGNGKVYHLTNCGHVYCEECSKAGNGKCFICQRPCNKTLLGGQLKPEIEIFFADRMMLLKKLQKHIQQVYQVFEFQQSHQNRLNEYRRKKAQEGVKRDNDQSNMESKLQKAIAHIKNLDEENQTLKTKVTKMKQYIDQIRDDTPMNDDLKKNHMLFSARNTTANNMPAAHTYMPNASAYKASPFPEISTTVRDNHHPHAANTLNNYGLTTSRNSTVNMHVHNQKPFQNQSINDNSREKLYTPNNAKILRSPNRIYQQTVKSNKSNHSSMSFQSNGSHHDKRFSNLGQLTGRKNYIKANEIQPFKDKISSDFVVKLPATFNLPTLRR